MGLWLNHQDITRNKSESCVGGSQITELLSGDGIKMSLVADSGFREFLESDY